MGVRNEAAVAASIGASTTSSMTEANTTATSSATMAVNDNAHLSLAELQQMAAYQQQQIQAQQSLLMAKEQRLKFLREQQEKNRTAQNTQQPPPPPVTQENQNDAQGTENEIRIRCLRDTIANQDVKLQRLQKLKLQVDKVRQGSKKGTTDLEAVKILFNEKEKELANAVSKVNELTQQLDDLRSSKASNGDGNKAGNGKAVPRELEKLRRELTAKQKENKDQEKLLNHQKYILTQRKEELKSMDQRIQELTTRLLKKKRHNQQAATGPADVPVSVPVLRSTTPVNVQVKSASLPNPGGSGGGVSDGQTQQPGLLNKENSEPRLDVPTDELRNRPSVIHGPTPKILFPQQQPAPLQQPPPQQQQQQQHQQPRPPHPQPAHLRPGASPTPLALLLAQGSRALAEETNYEPPPAPLMPRPFIDGVSDLGPLPSGAAFNEAAEAANDFGTGDTHTNPLLDDLVSQNSSESSLPHPHLRELAMRGQPEGTTSDSSDADGTPSVKPDLPPPSPGVITSSTPSVAALTAQWAAQHGNNNNSNNGNNNPGSSSSNLLGIPSASATTTTTTTTSATTNNTMTGLSASSAASSSATSGSDAGGASSAPQMIYDYPTKGGQHNIYDKPPTNARFGPQGSSGTQNNFTAQSAANQPYPASQMPSSHPSSSSSSSLTSHSSASSIMYAPKSAITNMYTGRMGQTTFQEQVVARQKQNGASHPSTLPPSSVAVASSGVVYEVPSGRPLLTTTAPISSSFAPPISGATSNFAPSNFPSQPNINNAPSALQKQQQVANAYQPNAAGVAGWGDKPPVQGLTRPVIGGSQPQLSNKILAMPQASSVGSSLSVQPSFFNSSLLSHQQQQQQLQQLQQQQQPNAMIWASPGLKHLGSQSRLSVPLGLPSSAGDYQMQTGGAPGVYQLPPVADTGKMNALKHQNSLRSLLRRHSYTESEDDSSSEASGAPFSHYRLNHHLAARTPPRGFHAAANKMAVILDDAAAAAAESAAAAASANSTAATTTSTLGESKVKSIMKKQASLMSDNKKKRLGTSLSRRVSFDPLALLLDASLEGELELVKKTATEVADASAANDEGITALHNAICAGHFDIVKFLVEFGCDVNAQDSDGWTPLHCAASCNNLAMVRFLVEHGACIFATTISDQETAAEKCEEDEEGYDGCSEYLYSVQEKLGILNNGAVYTLYSYQASNADELTFAEGRLVVVIRKGDEVERDWWWGRLQDTGKGSKEGAEGYVPKNLLGLYPRVAAAASASMTGAGGE